MKLFVQSLCLLVAAALGLAIGFSFRALKVELDSDARVVRETVSARGEKQIASSFVAGRKMALEPALDDSPLATELAHKLSISSRVARWLHWLEAIEKASLSDFPRLAALAKGDATAVRLLANRWIQLDLPHLFNTLAATENTQALPFEELSEVMLMELARRDPDTALAALQGTNSFGTRDMWRYIVGGYLIEKDPERGLRAISDWGMDNFSPRMTGVAKWAAANPRHAAEVTLAHPAGYTSEMAIETIAREWAKTDPFAAMEFASTKPDSLATHLANAVLKNWARTNLQDAANWLAMADLNLRRRFSPAFVEVWVKTDPTNALAWCEVNLRGQDLARTMGNIVNEVARRDAAAAAEFVTTMYASPARAEAAVAVARHWFPGWRSGNPAPASAITWLASLDAASTKRAVEQIQWKWSNGDPKSMAEFLVTAAIEKVPPSADLNVARSLARQNPQEAFAWASRLPGERGQMAGREAFKEWRYAQPELAMNWLNELPPTDPRRKLFVEQQIQ